MDTASIGSARTRHTAAIKGNDEHGNLLQANGVVHRDLKPDNIFLMRDGDAFVAKVTDFGLAKAVGFADLSGLTATGSGAGTPIHMPRQQLLDFTYAKPAVDVWAAAA